MRGRRGRTPVKGVYALNKVSVLAFEDRSRPEGGRAVIVLAGLKELPVRTSFRLRPADGADDRDGGSSWPTGEHLPLTARVTGEGIELVIGPDLAESQVLMPGTPVEIELSHAAVKGEFLWPTITPSARPRRKNLLAKRPQRDVRPNGIGADPIHHTPLAPDAIPALHTGLPQRDAKGDGRADSIFDAHRQALKGAAGIEAIAAGPDSAQHTNPSPQSASSDRKPAAVSPSSGMNSGVSIMDAKQEAEVSSRRDRNGPGAAASSTHSAPTTVAVNLGRKTSIKIEPEPPIVAVEQEAEAAAAAAHDADAVRAALQKASSMHFLSTKFYTLARDSQEQVGAAFHSSSRGYAMARASHARPRRGAPAKLPPSRTPLPTRPSATSLRTRTMRPFKLRLAAAGWLPCKLRIENRCRFRVWG